MTTTSSTRRCRGRSRYVARRCARRHLEWRPTAAINPLAPYFPPFTHFVIVYRENHTFDDYLGDCATTIQAGCHGQVQSTNHISSVPNLHTLAKTYALLDAYSTGTQPPSGPNHWWLFSAQSSSSSQQQSYPAATGTQFDRFLGGTTGPAGEGTSACTAQTGTGTGSSPYTFMMAGDFYWMLSSGSGYWRNPGTGNLEVLPVNRPGTTIPGGTPLQRVHLQRVRAFPTRRSAMTTSTSCPPTGCRRTTTSSCSTTTRAPTRTSRPTTPKPPRSSPRS